MTKTGTGVHFKFVEWNVEWEIGFANNLNGFQGNLTAPIKKVGKVEIKKCKKGKKTFRGSRQIWTNHVYPGSHSSVHGDCPAVLSISHQIIQNSGSEGWKLADECWWLSLILIFWYFLLVSTPFYITSNNTKFWIRGLKIGWWVLVAILNPGFSDIFY